MCRWEASSLKRPRECPDGSATCPNGSFVLHAGAAARWSASLNALNGLALLLRVRPELQYGAVSVRRGPLITHRKQTLGPPFLTAGSCTLHPSPLPDWSRCRRGMSQSFPMAARALFMAQTTFTTRQAQSFQWDAWCRSPVQMSASACWMPADQRPTRSFQAALRSLECRRSAKCDGSCSDV